MTDRVSFYGDASLPHYQHGGHFTYGPELRGIPSWKSVTIPRELWGNLPDTPYSKWQTHQYDHAHLLPWVPVRPEHRVCRERSRGNKDHHWDCACSQGREEGQAPGTAQLTHTANYTVLACWDYTGDKRGGCYSMFWIKGKLSANDMVAAIRRDFPCIWARITAGSGTMDVWGDDPPPMATAVDAAVVEEVTTPASTYDLSIPDELVAPAYDNSIPDELFAKACAMAAPQLVQIVEDATPANERLRYASARRSS